MTKQELETRTKRFALRVIRFVGGMPRSQLCDVLGRQLLRSGTSVGANYREANRAESRSDFVHKIAIAEKEASECMYWLELIDGTAVGNAVDRTFLVKECGELLAIFTSIGRTCKADGRLRSHPASRAPRMGGAASNPKSEIRNPKS